MGAVSTKVLVVDDEPAICSAISARLMSCGFACQTSTEPQHAKELLASRQFDVLIADIAMPIVSGLELLAYAKRHAPGCKVILITGKSDREALAQSLMLGADEYLEKPFSAEDLATAVARAAHDESDTPELPLRAADAIRSDSPTKQVALASAAG